MIVIDKNRCPQDHRCPAIKICPVGAISQIGHELPRVNQNKCIGCEKCITFCPKNAIIKSE